MPRFLCFDSVLRFCWEVESKEVRENLQHLAGWRWLKEFKACFRFKSKAASGCCLAKVAFAGRQEIKLGLLVLRHKCQLIWGDSWAVGIIVWSQMLIWASSTAKEQRGRGQKEQCKWERRGNRTRQVEVLSGVSVKQPRCCTSLWHLATKVQQAWTLQRYSWAFRSQVTYYVSHHSKHF